MPQTNSSTEEAITSQSSTLPVAFRSGFLPISPKTGFFHAKWVSKRTPTAFLVVVTLCSITRKVLGCFLFIFAIAVASTTSARARTKKSTQNCQKRRFFYFCTKIALLSLKTGAKAHTKLQQGKTSMHKCFPVEKYTIKKIFHTILQKTDTSGMRGGSFAVFFLNTQTS